MAKKDFYKTLQVDPRADLKVIEAAYRVLAIQYRDDDETMKALNEAQETLTDVDNRKKYDKERKPAGKIIGDYRIVDKIAEGGFGTTYKAEHVRLDSPVCIKHALNIGPTEEKTLLDEACDQKGLKTLTRDMVG